MDLSETKNVDDEDDGGGTTNNTMSNQHHHAVVKDLNANSAVNHNKPNRSSSESSRKNSLVKDGIKKSGSFLSNINTQSSQQQKSDEQNEQHQNNSNLPSSIASAFSTISSFTSSFSLSSTNGNASNLTIETASTSTKLSLITETKEDLFLKKASLERKNLIDLTKLIVKDLISSSLSVGRTIDDCQNATHLNNYFTLIDRVLKHGLKQNLLSNRSASLWTALDSLPKYLKESTLMSESVRSLAHTKTPDGKIKAWMRLAMMQKKLPEYFNELLANKMTLLKDVYHDYAFMLNDEAHVFAGLIIGVNVIDCNYFVKDANFDLMDDIIELSPYLRAASSFDEDDQQYVLGEHSKGEEVQNLTKVLDQKNYLEEWNKRLESTINNLQAKIKNLQEQNSKLEMEIKVSEVRIQKLTGKANDFNSGDKPLSGIHLTDAIKNFINTQSSKADGSGIEPPISSTDDLHESFGEEVFENPSKQSDETITNGDQTVQNPAEAEPQVSAASIKKSEDQERAIRAELERYKTKVAEQELELANLHERVGILETSYRSALDKIKLLERDLDVQTSLNSDKETTIKIYEKDIREKQSQVESLRNSLNDSKKLNSDLSERLNDTSVKLKDRINSVSNLQTSLDKWKLENKTLASRFQDKQTALQTVKDELDKSTKLIESLKEYNQKINDDLSKERECGQTSSVTVETQNTKITELNDKISSIEAELNEARPYRKQCEELRKKCQEYEQSLEEVGYQLRESRLEVESLKENSSVFLDSQWMDSKQVKSCALCEQAFSVTRRKHHCRLCGNVFCQTCSDNKMELASSSKPARVCDTCHAFLLAKFIKSSASS